MANPSSIDDFLATLRTSGLMTEENLVKALDEMCAAGINPTDAASLADAFVKREVLTAWQAEMLLKGKHRGFHLGPYVLMRPLGQGAMGHVFLAEHVMMRRKCAIKLLAQKYKKDPDLIGALRSRPSLSLRSIIPTSSEPMTSTATHPPAASSTTW